MNDSKFTFSQRVISAFVAVFFLGSTIFPVSFAKAQSPTHLNILPAVGKMLSFTPTFNPAIAKGLTIYPDNPLKFDFIIDSGDENFDSDTFYQESEKMIKYFMASLTVPEDDIWVNLSPYEANRMIPNSLGITEMGVDLLAQDYILKQLMASLLYPEERLGSEFWKRVYSKALAKYGTTDIPIDTFNKIWIIPDKAVVYEQENTVFVVEQHLKVMLEEDYIAFKATNNSSNASFNNDQPHLDEFEDLPGTISDIVREVLIPEIERELNEGETFKTLRQIYNSMILAVWYKKNLKNSLLGQVYVDRNKVQGVDISDKSTKDTIYNQYLEAFKVGVFDFIKEEVDSKNQESILRKYFSGGLTAVSEDLVQTYKGDIGNQPAFIQDGVLKTVGSSSIVSFQLVENAKSLGRKLKSSMKNLILVSTACAAMGGCAYVGQQVPSQDWGQLQFSSKDHDLSYWMNIANQDYAQVFSRAKEFVKKPFAYDVLFTALSKDPDADSSSIDLALKNFGNFANHPRVFEIGQEIVDQRGFSRISNNIEELIKHPSGKKIINYAIKVDPDGAVYYFTNYLNKEAFIGFLQESTEPIVKVFLKMINWDAKGKLDFGGDDREGWGMMMLFPEEVLNGSLSVEDLKQLLKDKKKTIEKLSGLLKNRDILAYENVQVLFHFLSKDLLREISYSDSPETELSGLSSFSDEALVLFLGSIFELDNSSIYDDETFDLLMSLLMERLRVDSDFMSDFLESPYFISPIRSIITTLVIEDKLDDFLSLMSQKDVERILDLVDVRFPHPLKYIHDDVRQFDDLVTPFLILQYMLNNFELSSNDRANYLQISQDFKQRISELKRKNPRNLMVRLDKYQTNEFLRTEIWEATINMLKNKTENAVRLFFWGVGDYVNSVNGVDAFTLAATYAPTRALLVLSNANVMAAVTNSDEPLLNFLLKIHNSDMDENQKKRLVLFADSVLNGNMTFSEAIYVSESIHRSLKVFRQIENRGGIGVFEIKEYISTLRSKFLKLVRRMDDVHEEADQVFFSDIENFESQDIYSMIVYGKEEIFTTTFNRIFDRLLLKMRSEGISGDQLLESVDYYDFRGFLGLTMGFGRINKFLNTMEKDKGQELLARFLDNIEQESEFLEQAAVVADAFATIKDKELLASLQRGVKEQYDRVKNVGHKEGIVIYGILSGMFGNKAVIDKEWFENISKRFGLIQIDKLEIKDLFNSEGVNIQRLYFHNDADGDLSFKNFLKTKQDNSDWKIIEDQERYMILETTAPGRKVKIYTNKPDKEKKGSYKEWYAVQEEIDNILNKRGESVTIAVHRGHSYHADETIKEILKEAIIVSLGSCGGFHLIHDVLEKSPLAHILSTKGTGSMYVNDPLLRMLNRWILKEQTFIKWADFWKEAQRVMNPKLFKDYVAPHENVAALFFKAYKKHISLAEVDVSKSDQAGSSIPPVGGIDLTSDVLDLQVIRDKDGVPLPVFQQPIDTMRIDGFSPVILDVIPVNIPNLLGYTPKGQVFDELGKVFN